MKNVASNWSWNGLRYPEFYSAPYPDLDYISDAPEYVISTMSKSPSGVMMYDKGTPKFLEKRKEQMSKILARYKTSDPRLRPNMNQINKIYVNIKVVGIGPVSDLQEEFVITMFFRMTWYDDRLKFNETYFTSDQTFKLNNKVLDNIWYPDIFFRNSKTEYFHDNTQANRLIRIDGNVKINMSSRISIVAKCPMNFENFPFDVHTCSLLFSSYQYTASELMLVWQTGNGTRSVSIPRDKATAATGHIGQRLLQFRLKHAAKGNDTVASPTGSYSTLIVCFQFERALIYYLINTYFPCYLLVILSQVSFWINKEATPARMTYGSMTVLALTQMSISERQSTPKVSYVTAYDLYITTCFCFCFAALVEFAIVNHFTIIAPKKVIDDVVTRRKSQRKELMEKKKRTQDLRQSVYNQSFINNLIGGHEKRKMEREIEGQGFAQSCLTQKMNINQKNLEATMLKNRKEKQESDPNLLDLVLDDHAHDEDIFILGGVLGWYG